MENQVPEEVVKERFDRLLTEVQAISAQVCGRDVHTVQEVLVEEPDSHVEGLVTGRMSNNTIVHFPGGKELIGKIVKSISGGIQGILLYGIPSRLRRINL